jgi:hypothetical protein
LREQGEYALSTRLNRGDGLAKRDARRRGTPD